MWAWPNQGQQSKASLAWVGLVYSGVSIKTQISLGGPGLISVIMKGRIACVSLV